ncbi:MAG: photosystem I assembly protein Ycf4 [Gammaproteobacteria bacterium]
MTDNNQGIKDPLLLKEYITPKNKNLNTVFNVTLTSGSIAFLLTGIQSYITNNLPYQINSKYIIFYPQGLTMCIYGIIGTLIGLKLLINQYQNLGEGYNEFNKKNGEVKIYRRKTSNENIYLKYKINDIVCNREVK